jgi:hypothetical protein
MKPYIDFNTAQRAKATYEFEKDMFKLMNNAVFGKTLQNQRQQLRFTMCNDETKFQKLVNDPCFESSVIINDSLCGVTRKKSIVKLDKCIAVGFCVLDMSKLLMYDFHYNTIKKQYGDRSKLLFTDTDSLTYEIKTDDIYADMSKDKQLYDFSDYPKDHPLYSVENKKVIGKMKDESSSLIIEEFVGLRSKMYSFTTHTYESKKCKGVKRTVVKNELKFSDYRRSLLGGVRNDIQQKVSFNTIRSYKHELYSISQTKIGLCSFDDKRYVLSDGIHTLAHGHHKIKK